MSKIAKRSRISNKLILSIILFSSLITLCLTLIQLYFEYRGDIDFLNDNIENVETGYREGITNALWLDDKQQLIAILNGIGALPDIEYIEVQVNSEFYASSGDRVEVDSVKSSFFLKYEYDDKLLTIGEVFVEASLRGIYQNLFVRAWTLLISNSIKTFLVVIFMYYLFERLLFRRLKIIFDFIRNYDIHNLNRRINLGQNKADVSDEIYELANAINTIQEQLSLSVNELLLLKTTLDLSLDAVVMFYPDNYKFFYANAGATKLLGYSTEDLFNMTPSEIIKDLDKENFKWLIHQVIEKDEHVTEFETEFCNKNGVVIPVSLSLQYVNPENEAPRFICIASDITKRKNDEIKLLRSLETANIASEAKSNFLTSMSHELRTPLNAVLGFSQLLALDSDKLNPSQNSAVNDIIQSGQHLLSLIEDVLNLSSIETNHAAITLELVDPVNLIDECFKTVLTLSHTKNIKLENKIDVESLPKINIDKTRFKQVLINLLNNAIKYNKKGGSVTLDYELFGKNGIRFKVVDTGCGIKASDKMKVFEPFNRLGHEAGVIEGTGIGLNITKKLVELMNGEIDFKSSLGEGSEFWVDFYCDVETKSA